jgi:hypothetical protein
VLGNASEATETDGSGKFENRRYLPALVELMKASGHMFNVAFRQHILKKDYELQFSSSCDHF